MIRLGIPCTRPPPSKPKPKGARSFRWFLPILTAWLGGFLRSYGFCTLFPFAIGFVFPPFLIPDVVTRIKRIARKQRRREQSKECTPPPGAPFCTRTPTSEASFGFSAVSFPSRTPFDTSRKQSCSRSSVSLSAVLTVFHPCGPVVSFSVFLSLFSCFLAASLLDVEETAQGDTKRIRPGKAAP